MLAALVAGCGGWSDPSREFAEPVTGAATHPVDVVTPPGLGALDTGRTDINGAPIGIACATCHSTGADMEPIVASLGNPESMHASIELKHGDLSCASCHDDERDNLRLADGRTLEMEEAMALCSQCHGPQRRDYDAGSHGGMQGYWDLRRGPRTRNHCLSCHSAHAPAFEGGRAVFPPKDRHLPTPHGEDGAAPHANGPRAETAPHADADPGASHE